MDKPHSFATWMKMADELPLGDERILFREKAINMADLSGNEADMFEARSQYVQDLSKLGGYSQKYFSVFPWLLDYAEKKGSAYDRMLVLWIYKWVILEMGNYTFVTRTQVEAALEDLRKRYLAFGSNEKVYEQYAYTAYAESLQDMEKAREHYRRWCRFKRRDDLDDCEACVVNRHVLFLIKDGMLKKALSIAEPVLSGKLSCTHVPKDTWSKLILPLYNAGDQENSRQYAGKLGRKLKSMKYQGNLDAVHPLIIYHAKLGEFPKAIFWLEKFMPTALEQMEMNGKFWFYTANVYLMNHMPRQKVKLKLPASFKAFEESGEYDVQTLKDWFDKEASQIASQFDRRNGNNGFAESKEKLLQF